MAVEELEAPTPPGRKKRDPFAIVPLDLAAAMTAATNTKRAFVCIALLYAAWRAKGEPFAFTNAQLNRAKVDRFTKQRTLEVLEAAGLIEVKRHPGRSPIVTLKGRLPST